MHLIVLTLQKCASYETVITTIPADCFRYLTPANETSVSAQHFKS